MAELPAFDEFDVEEFTDDLKARATENATATVKYGSAGVLVGAATLGPIGGVLGASLGSAAGYLVDEGYIGSADEPEVVEAAVDR